MSNGEYIDEIQISSYDKLIQIIRGKTKKCNDLRDNFIFRGVEDCNFELIPSALRDDNINSYVDEDFKITLKLLYKQAVNYGFLKHDENNTNFRYRYFTINKYGEVISDKKYDVVGSLDEVQFRKEFNALINFLDYGDKVGLKIPSNSFVRNFIEHGFGKNFRDNSFWPDKNFYELISLAQHYGIPTRALDWSYDYKVALYFALKNILADDYQCGDKPDYGVLWAFNYKYFEKERLGLSHNPFKIEHYRPEYNSNPNLNAQKGLFTFIINDLHHITRKPFDQFIVSLLDGTHDFKSFEGKKFLEAPPNEKAFYKFIIAEELKPEILNELYKEGYSEEYLFPGYDGVTQSVKNRINLDKLLNKSHNCDKRSLLVSFTNDEVNKIFNSKTSYVFRKSFFHGKIDKIFIYLDNEVKGYFRCGKVIKNTPQYLIDNFCNDSKLKHEIFNYFENLDEGYAIEIMDLINFEYPIYIDNILKDYCFVDEYVNLKFLLNFP